ncbi:hypothetical protein Nos7524_3793 [Nostoc sp. PCC 7524]|uniref:AAA family ATPase n=1 Tax=Nostoc sp. (strain ATCC 29411 / PCC 7524) TaxID=28072 RepID=UPI00029EC4C1|nr:AAA family ATPase [Nostoc sp. PCC 7524]AFY49572.1 hypothetical protein Nos7524_3793 [Nostoc sp. PCC 7524]
MKVKIANLGVIEQAEIDLKPLTVFIGRNGTGKTWTAYTLASIFGEHGFDRYCKSYIDGKTLQKYPTIDNAIEQFLQEGSVEFDIVKFVEEYAEIYINDLSSMVHNWMKTFMGTERVFFEKTEVKFNLAAAKTGICEYIKKLYIDEAIYFGTTKKNIIHTLKEADKNNIYFYITSEDNFLNKMPKRSFKSFLVQGIFEILHRAFYSYVYIFPTERTTFITFSAKKEIIRRENIVNEDNVVERNLSEERKVQPSVAVQSLLEILITAYEKKSGQREEELQNNPKIADYIQLADLIEKEILEGKVVFDEHIYSRELLFQPAENIQLEMRVASSMVKELALLVLCLRYLAEPDELLIIDEPEMNLHPAVQVEITELLAMLVQAGLKVLITTHSPYIVEHLGNLMEAAKRKDKDDIKKRFYLERTEAFIPKEKVSIYLFEDGTAKNILNEEGRIDWGTFGDVSDDISHIFP